MSYTEINHKRGMPYGGMPYDAILRKLEETDPALGTGAADVDEFFDIEDAHRNYVRAEIVDWSPDNTYLESDHHRRDPALSRSIVNLRYNGTRGSEYELPRHPELFLGFTGNDPRGRDTAPRFDKARGHGEARARNYEVRMGHNVGHGGGDGFQVSDRPWSGPALEYAKKEMHRRARDNYMNWFTTEKEGRPWGRNQVADPVHGLRTRGTHLESGEEGLADLGGGAPARFAQGDHGPAGGFTGAPRRVDRGGASETAPWRLSTGDTDLAVAKYGAEPAGGRTLGGGAGHGGALAGHGHHDQELGVQRAGPAARRALAEGMSAGAAYRRAAARGGIHDTDYSPPGSGLEIRTVGRTAPALATNIAAAASAVISDQRPGGRAPTTIGDDEGGALGAAAGLTPPGDTQGALRNIQGAPPPSANARLGDVVAIARGLREGSAAGRRQAKQQVRTGGRFGAELGVEALGRAPRPGQNLGGAASATEAPLARAAAARDLEVANYRGTAAPSALSRVGSATPDGGLRWSLPGRREGRQKSRPDFLSHTQTSSNTETGAPFGSNAAGGISGARVGSKNLRTTHLSDLGDEVLQGLDDDNLTGG